MSVASSQMSTKSRKEEILDEIRAEKQDKPEWDISQAGHDGKARDEQELLASRLANEVLDQYPNLKNVHSKQSVKVMLESEARKQLEEGGVYSGPMVATHKDHMKKEKVEASNLPYLHKNPAI